MSTLLVGGRSYSVNKQGPHANEGGESVACSKWLAPYTLFINKVCALLIKIHDVVMQI